MLVEHPAGPGSGLRLSTQTACPSPRPELETGGNGGESRHGLKKETPAPTRIGSVNYMGLGALLCRSAGEQGTKAGNSTGAGECWSLQWEAGMGEGYHPQVPSFSHFTSLQMLPGPLSGSLPGLPLLPLPFLAPLLKTYLFWDPPSP